MRSVSYIIEGSHATLEDVQILSNSAAALSKIDNELVCEYILYADSALKISSLPYVSIVFSQKMGISSFEKAIATASGEKLVFTTLKNALTEPNFDIYHQTYSLDGYHVVVPIVSTNQLFKVIGIRAIRDVKYLIVSKDFAVSHHKALIEPQEAIRLADKHLVLGFVETIETKLPDTILKKVTFLRPYYRIAKQKYQIKKQALKDLRKQRRDEKLSRQVPPVPYSPDIPVFIICRDRVEPLKKLVKWLEKEGLRNIYFVDNASTYRPLLDYYSKTPYEVVRLRANVGHTSPWKAGIINIYAKNTPYIVTDPDVIPSEDSHGAVKRFCELLTKYPERRKVGFGLKIDDLPDHYELKKHVISWEKQFWVTEKEPLVYDAEIDTTFALYRQGTPYVMGPGLRTGGDYVARHEPWYMDSKNLSEEVKYYREHADKAVGSWGVDESELSDTYSGHSFKNNK